MPSRELIKLVSEYMEKTALFAAVEGNDRDLLRPELAREAEEVEKQIQAWRESRDRPGAIRSILVAVDDSEPAEWAVDEAVRLADDLDARVSLVHVIDTAPILSDGFATEAPDTRPGLIEQAHKLLQSLADRVPRELLGDQFLREGVAARQIIAAAEENKADLIVMGTHGRGALGRFLIGSVAEAVVRHAPCPVLTINHPRKGAAPEPYPVRPASAQESKELASSG